MIIAIRIIRINLQKINDKTENNNNNSIEKVILKKNEKS